MGLLFDSPLRPGSIMTSGASERPGPVGRQTTHNLPAASFNGTPGAINPTFDSVTCVSRHTSREQPAPDSDAFCATANRFSVLCKELSEAFQEIDRDPVIANASASTNLKVLVASTKSPGQNYMTEAS